MCAIWVVLMYSTLKSSKKWHYSMSKCKEMLWWTCSMVGHKVSGVIWKKYK